MVSTQKKVSAAKLPTPKITKVVKKTVKTTAPEHPKFSIMITEAIRTLADKKGSSYQAIQKFICANYKVGVNYERSLKKALKAALEEKSLTKPKGVGLTGSFKLTKIEKPKVAKKPVEKKVVKKPVAKEVVKKPVAKKVVTKKASPVKKAKITKKVTTPKKVVKKPVAKKVTKAKK
jgi:histone H1/5